MAVPLLVPETHRLLVTIVAETAPQRAKLSNLLAQSRGFRIAGSYSFTDAGRILRESHTDVILGYADSKPGCLAFRALARQHENKLSVLLISNPDRLEQHAADRAINFCRALPRGSDNASVMDGLHSLVAETRIVGVPVQVAEARDHEKLARLSERERDVLVMTADGLSIKEIAARLHRGYGTIASHRDAIMKKLGLHDKVALARFAIRVGLIEA